MSHFFIFDCTGQVVGNPKGYATHTGATNQANSVKTKAGRAIWDAYHAQNYMPGERRVIYRISTLETAQAKGYAA
jgi:hypothetical protein